MGNQCVPFIKLSSYYTCTPREELAHGRSFLRLKCFWWNLPREKKIYKNIMFQYCKSSTIIVLWFNKCFKWTDLQLHDYDIKILFNSNKCQFISNSHSGTEMEPVLHFSMSHFLFVHWIIESNTSESHELFRCDAGLFQFPTETPVDH